MHRRHLFQFAAVSLGSLAIGADETTIARDMYSTIAAGDDGPLAVVQTTHAVDHAIRRLAVREPSQSLSSCRGFAKAGHLHAATVETFFARAYLNVVEP
jgi:hypothetical protein